MTHHIDDISLAIERIQVLDSKPQPWREPWKVLPQPEPEIEREPEPILTGQEAFA